MLSRGGGTCCLLLDLVTLPSSALLDSLKVQSDGTTVCVCECVCVQSVCVCVYCSVCSAVKLSFSLSLH